MVSIAEGAVLVPSGTPLGSVAVAETPPPLSGAGGVKLNRPWPSAVTLPTGVMPSKSCTEARGSVVPLIARTVPSSS